MSKGPSLLLRPRIHSKSYLKEFVSIPPTYAESLGRADFIRLARPDRAGKTSDSKGRSRAANSSTVCRYRNSQIFAFLSIVQTKPLVRGATTSPRHSQASVFRHRQDSSSCDRETSRNDRSRSCNTQPRVRGGKRRNICPGVSKLLASLT